MSKKGILYILLVLVLALTGSGAWLLYGSTAEDVPEGSPVTINLPEGEPVIYEQVRYLMGGENYELYIYDDGGILYIEEKGLRFPMPEYPATRTWSTGNFTAEQVNSLLEYLEHSGLDELDEYYQFPGEPIAPPGNGLGMSDLHYTITVNSGTLSKMVRASGYLSPDGGATYPDMPAPINKIYERLRTISAMTEEVYQEEIRD